MKTLEAELEVLPPAADQSEAEPQTLAVPAADSSDVARSHTGQRRFRISRDALNFDGLTPAQRQDAEWLWTFCAQRDLGTTEIGKLLVKGAGPEAYSYESVYQFLTGRRAKQGADLGPMCEALAAFRRKADTQPVHGGYLETRMAREIVAYAQETRRRGLAGFLIGKMTMGKTTPLQELARRDPGVVYVRMPTAGTRARLLEQLAGKLAMGKSQSIADLSQRVIESFDSTMLLVVDEADQAFNATKISAGLSTLDFLRELYDHARCGILLVMDDQGLNHFRTGLHKQRLGRLWRRRLPIKQLPDVPYADDLDLFAAQYGLPPAPHGEQTIEIKAGRKTFTHTDSPRRLQDAVLERDGLLIWISLLEEARDTARAAKRDVTWGAVLRAHALMAASEEGAR